MAAMKKRLFILIFCAVLFTAVCRVGFDNGDTDADVNDVNGIPDEAFLEPDEPDDLMVLQFDRSVL